MKLPSYGDTVVAVIGSDEECWIPPYLDKVRYIFKTYGFRPGAALRCPSSRQPQILKCVRDWGVWSWHHLSYLRQNGFSPERGGRKMVVPLGYARRTDLPGKPFETRRYPVRFFSTASKTGVIPGFRPRGYSRAEMRRTLATGQVFAKAGRSVQNSVFYGTTASFTESTMTGAGARYTEIMADTKIVLAPRVSSVETDRFLEAMRQVCAVIRDRLSPTLVLRRLPRYTD
jgi:hypothetical protein